MLCTPLWGLRPPVGGPSADLHHAQETLLNFLIDLTEFYVKNHVLDSWHC